MQQFFAVCIAFLNGYQTYKTVFCLISISTTVLTKQPQTKPTSTKSAFYQTTFFKSQPQKLPQYQTHEIRFSKEKKAFILGFG
jgi:hypothetical protein